MSGANENYILLIEDNADDVQLTVRALQRLEIHNEIVVVRDGAEALEALLRCEDRHSKAPCLILLDLKLPKVSGRDVLKRVRATPATQDVPVVVLSTSREDLEAVRGENLGALDYVPKTFHRGEFAQSLGVVKRYCS